MKTITVIYKDHAWYLAHEAQMTDILHAYLRGEYRGELRICFDMDGCVVIDTDNPSIVDAIKSI